MKLQTVDIKGKAYVTVAERLKHFRSSEDFRGWAIDTNWIVINDKEAIAKVIAYNEKGEIKSCGTASEKAGDSFINKTSHIENCETSAIGRCLGNLGIGLEGGEVASYEEVFRAKKMQLLESINSMIDDNNRDEIVDSFGDVSELALKPIETLEVLNKQLLVREKSNIIKSITEMTTEEEFGRILEKFKTKNLINLDLNDLIVIHNKINNAKFKISKKEIQDLKECADILGTNINSYIKTNYNKKIEELTKKEYQEIKEKLNS